MVIDGRPTIGLLECSGHRPEQTGLHGSRLARSGTAREYTAEVQFGPGRWAVSAVGLRPAHLDLGMHRVRAAPVAGAEEAHMSPPPASGPAPWAAIGVLGVFGLTASALALRRSRRSAP